MPTNKAQAQESFLAAVNTEYARARQKNGPYHSHHEAYAVLLEEVDEYWDQVKKKPSKRDPKNMYEELVQIAQVAMATAVELIGFPVTDSEEEGSDAVKQRSA